MEYLHDCIDATTVALPHGSESRLAANVPDLNGNIAFGDFTHIETNCGYHILRELTGLLTQRETETEREININ